MYPGESAQPKKKRRKKEKQAGTRDCSVSCQDDTYDIPACSWSPPSNTHARPFKNITPPMGDVYIAADISMRRGGEVEGSPLYQSKGTWDEWGKTNGARRALAGRGGFTLPHRRFEKWGRGEGAR